MRITNHTIDQILAGYEPVIGNQFDAYQNHVYRVFEFCQMLDPNPDHAQKYAIAAAYHDIGIWTNQTFDYLAPSMQKAKEFLVEIDKEEWSEEISLMIDMHHKRSKYEGPFQNTVEIFRRADLIDVTKGRKSFKLSKEEIRRIIGTYPNHGFHKFLVIETIKNFFRSPLNPLPMIKS